MRLSIRQLLLITTLLAAILAIGIPAGKFFFYDKVNFEYDQQQAAYYFEDLSGDRGDAMNCAFKRLTVWNRNDIFIALASESSSTLTLEWITANPSHPDQIIVTLDTGAELSFTVTDVNSTSAVSYFAMVPTNVGIPTDSKVRSVRLCIGPIESEECIVQFDSG